MRGVWAFPLALATCIVPLTCAYTHFPTPRLIPDIVIGNVKVSDSLGRVSLGTTRAVFFFFCSPSFCFLFKEFKQKRSPERRPGF